MGAVTSVFVRKVVNAVREEVDASSLLKSVGIDPDADMDVRAMVSDHAYYGMLERIARTIDDATGLPLRVGGSMRCDDYGAFGLAWKTAPTLRGSIARAERYWRLLTSVTDYELRQDDDKAIFVLNRAGERRLGLRLSNENSLASVVSIIREISPVPFSPLKVLFKHPAPETVAAHELYFGCPCVWEADLDALVLSAEALATENQKGDAALSAFFTSHLDDELEQVQREETIGEQVRATIAASLSDGVPKAQMIAKRLGLSERTLQRRLDAEGLSFQKLLDEVRKQMAESFLVNSDYSIAEIAFLTGFSEQSALNRAFKRWHDRTPASFRGVQA
ncbi:MAG: AraC family transcriptional regulator [Pseudomonadota bacterium]